MIRNKPSTLYKKQNIPFGDCLIATQIPPKSILITYDKDFKKFSHINSMTPEEIYEASEKEKALGTLVLNEK